MLCGSIGLAGGTITGNQSAGIVNEAAEITGGAIYSQGEIRVSGAVIVKITRMMVLMITVLLF
ncbi:MAG: hypothetical protein ACLTUL_03285 [Blautia faecis]